MKQKNNVTTVAAFTIVAMGALLFADESAQTVSPKEALAKLQAGNKRFATCKVTEGKPVAARRAETAQSQHPYAIIVGCADSRTSPELIFDQNLGDLFVIRTAGNLVDEHALGSIEYAVEHLGARLVVVLGHKNCGAVKAALTSATAPGNLNSLVRDIQPAVQAVKDKSGDKLDMATEENAKLVAAKIRAEAKLGELTQAVRIQTGIYDLDSGMIKWAKD